MSKIDEMLKQMCPDGVECVELGEVCEFVRGSGLQKSDKGTGDIPIILYGELYTEYGNYIKRVVSYASEKATKGCKIATEGDILLPISSTTKEAQIGKASVLLYDQVCIGGDMLILKHKQNPSYLMYVINSSAFELQKMKHVRGTTIMHLQPSGIAKIKIPLPPLEVQKEIVKVLDTFTKYDTELQAELQARVKQYEYYRDKLLSFDDNSQRGVIYKPLGDIFNIRNGYTPSRSNHAYWKNGTIPWFRMEDIRENGRILSDSIQHVTQEAAKGALWAAGSIIISTSATIGEYALIERDFIANQRFTVLSIKDKYVEEFNKKFIFHYCSRLSDFCKNNLNQGNFASVDMNKFSKFSFAIPPLPIQERIVSVLDNFDKICSDLKIGLPAEIEKRQKQYEYYRGKLLTFDPKS